MKLYRRITFHLKAYTVLLLIDAHLFHSIFISSTVLNLLESTLSIMKSSSENHRHVIWFLLQKGKSRREILDEMHDVYGGDCPSRSTIYKWIERFEDGWDTVDDDHRPGRPKSSSTQSNIRLIENRLDEDRHATVRELEERTGFSKSIIHTIIKDELEMSRVVARWVPKLLSEDQKKERVRASRDLLKSWHSEKDFLDRIVTGDESWFHYYEPETKSQSSQWKRKYEAPPVKVKCAPSAGKRMATVFWDREGILSIDWLPEKTTINSDYYVSELQELREAIKRERRGKLTRGIYLQHDNARPHVSGKTTDAIRRLGFKCLPHPPYSPDLAPSDYWLFGEMKKPLRGKRYGDLKELKRAVNHWVKVTPPEFYAKGIDKLPERWERCIKLDGDFIERFNSDID